MPYSIVRSTNSDSYAGPNPQELEGLGFSRSETDSWPSGGDTDCHRSPLPEVRSPPFSGSDPGDYSGPTRFELRTLTGWAMDTESALSHDVPAVLPAGRSRRVTTATPGRPNSIGRGAVPATTPETERGTVSKKPPSDSILRELDAIQASLQKR